MDSVIVGDEIVLEMIDLKHVDVKQFFKIEVLQEKS